MFRRQLNRSIQKIANATPDLGYCAEICAPASISSPVIPAPPELLWFLRLRRGSFRCGVVRLLSVLLIKILLDPLFYQTGELRRRE